MEKHLLVREAIKIQITRDLLTDATELASLATELQLDELLIHHWDNNGTKFIMVLDTIKRDLVKNGILTAKHFPAFGT